MESRVTAKNIFGGAMEATRKPMKWPACGNRRAFTLIELLVVITIIAILTAILLPAIKMVRTAAYSMACLNNLRQMGMSVNAYALDYEVLPPTYKELANAPGVGRIWVHTQAATYMESNKAGSDGNAAKDVLKCPGDRRPVSGADEAISGHGDDRLMQCVWVNNGDQDWSEFTRLWSSYASNHTVFTGDRRAAPSTVAMFWDSWEFTSEESPYLPGSAWGVPGTARHNRTTNMVYGDGHAGGITSSFMDPGRSWNLAGWMGPGVLNGGAITNVGNFYSADYTNSRLPPWRGQ